jgi:hypothetical protein
MGFGNVTSQSVKTYQSATPPQRHHPLVHLMCKFEKKLQTDDYFHSLSAWVLSTYLSHWSLFPLISSKFNLENK